MSYYAQKVEALTQLNRAQGHLIWLLFAVVVVLLIIIVVGVSRTELLIQDSDEISRFIQQWVF